MGGEEFGCIEKHRSPQEKSMSWSKRIQTRVERLLEDKRSSKWQNSLSIPFQRATTRDRLDNICLLRRSFAVRSVKWSTYRRIVDAPFQNESNWANRKLALKTHGKKLYNMSKKIWPGSGEQNYFRVSQLWFRKLFIKVNHARECER